MHDEAVQYQPEHNQRRMHLAITTCNHEHTQLNTERNNKYSAYRSIYIQYISKCPIKLHFISGHKLNRLRTSCLSSFSPLRKQSAKGKKTETEMLQMTTLVLLWELLSYRRKATEVRLVKERMTI